MLYRAKCACFLGPPGCFLPRWPCFIFRMALGVNIPQKQLSLLQKQLYPPGFLSEMQ